MTELLELRDCLLVIWYHQDLAQVLACGRLNVCSINDSLKGWVNKTGTNVLMLAGERVVSVQYFFATVIPPFYVIISHYVKSQLFYSLSVTATN